MVKVKKAFYPVEKNVRIYQQNYEIYKDIYHSAWDIWDKRQQIWGKQIENQEIKKIEGGNDMLKEVIMPKIGLDMEEGTILTWLKQAGDSVEEGEAGRDRDR